MKICPYVRYRSSQINHLPLKTNTDNSPWIQKLVYSKYNKINFFKEENLSMCRQLPYSVTKDSDHR